MRERRQVCLDVAQAQGRLTSVVGAVFHRYGVVRGGSSGTCPGLAGQYRIGSITKTFTAVLVMQARDAGLLNLDDPIGLHLGDVGYAEARVGELLSHTSGAQSEPAGPWWERSRGGDFQGLATTNDGSGRVARAGDYYHYSNLGYGLLGEVVARVTGRPWRQLVHEVLLAPLGMTQTSYLPPWVPTVALPTDVEGVPGLWFWGNSAVEARWHNEGLDLTPLAAFGTSADRFELHDGRLVGVSGYHRGESLHLHRRPDGTIGHLECATWIYTRTPYEPDAPIPGGHPRR